MICKGKVHKKVEFRLGLCTGNCAGKYALSCIRKGHLQLLCTGIGHNAWQVNCWESIVNISYSRKFNLSSSATFNMSGLYSSGSGSGKLAFDSVGMIFRLFLLQRFFKRKYSCHVLRE